MLVVILGRLFQVIVAFATIRLATTFLPPSEMGVMTLLTTVISFFSLFFVSSVGAYISRRLHAWYSSGQLKNYLYLHFLFLLLTALISAVIIIGLSKTSWVNFSQNLLFTILLLSLTLIFTTANQTNLSALNMLGFRNWFVVLSLFTTCSVLGFSILLVTVFEKNAYFWLGGSVIGQILFGILSWKLLKIKTIKHHVAAPKVVDLFCERASHIFNFIWPLTVTLILAWSQLQSYKFIFENSFGVFALGLFATGLGVSAGILASLESVLTTYLLPTVYKKINNEVEERWLKTWYDYALIVMTIILFFIVFIAFFHKEITKILVGPMYQAAASFVVGGAIIEFFRIGNGVLSLIAHAKMNTKVLIFPNLIGAISALGLSIILIPTLGMMGVLAALIVAGVLSFCIFLIFVLKPKIIFLDKKFILRSCLGLLSIILSFTFLKSVISNVDELVHTLIFLTFASGIFLAVLYLVIHKKIKNFMN